MARVLIKHWSGLEYDGNWKQFLEIVIADGGSKTEMVVPVNLADNDSSGQIKAKMADAIRASVTAETGWTVENNQIIFPDGTRG